MKTAIIVDDKPLARKNLCHLIHQFCPELSIVGEAGGVEEATGLIRKYPPHAVFFDMQATGGNVLQLFSDFQSPGFRVICTTDRSIPVNEAIQNQKIDFLMKPICVEDLQRTVRKICAKEVIPLHPDGKEEIKKKHRLRRSGRIVVSAQEGLVFLNLEQVVRLQSEANYTTFYMVDGGTFTASRTIKAFEYLLPEELFFRTHQSHIINLNYIRKILREDGGYALMIPGSKVPIARRRKETLLRLIDRLFVMA